MLSKFGKYINYLKIKKSGLYFSANGSSLLFGKSFFLIILSKRQLYIL